MSFLNQKSLSSITGTLLVTDVALFQRLIGGQLPTGHLLAATYVFAVSIPLLCFAWFIPHPDAVDQLPCWRRGLVFIAWGLGLIGIYHCFAHLDRWAGVVFVACVIIAGLALVGSEKGKQ